jgi:ABC-type glycerol-3-phosphate transport system permease component
MRLAARVQGLIVPNLASALGCFLYRQFFLNVPLELGEAARIDGASEWRIFLRVYRPLAQPMTAVSVARAVSEAFPPPSAAIRDAVSGR